MTNNKLNYICLYRIKCININVISHSVQMDESLEAMFKNKYFARNDMKNLIENALDRNHDGYISIQEWMQAMQLYDGES